VRRLSRNIVVAVALAHNDRANRRRRRLVETILRKQRQMKAIPRLGLLIALLGAVTFIGAESSGAQESPATQCAPAAGFPAATTQVAFWSTEPRCAIVPPTAGPENFGNKFPGEAAVYVGIVHVAIYDAAVAVEGGYRPLLPTPRAPADTSPAAAIAAAAHDTLVGLQPALGLTAAQQAILDSDYATYLATIPNGTAKTNGIAVGQQVAATVIAWRANDGREDNPTVTDLDPPAPGPGVWQPDPARPVLGLRLPGLRPLALTSASQFRPGGPPALTSHLYAHDLNQVEQLGAIDSSTRTPEQTEQAVLDRPRPPHVERRPAPPRRPAPSRPRPDSKDAGHGPRRGGDAMIACFDAKYHYWFWRPYQAIPAAATDGNPDTTADLTWQPLTTTPNFPEYPSAHACHSTAVVTALDAFFGTDNVPMTLDSRVTGTTRRYYRLHDIVNDVDWARVVVGFHYRNSDLQGSALGQNVGRYVTQHYFQPTRR